MRGRLGRGFIFHTISSEQVGPPSFPMFPNGQPCGDILGDGAAEVGKEYWDLSIMTGGRQFSICTPSSEWTMLFDNLTTAIAVPVSIPCEYSIPEPPIGGELDFNRVNVRYTPSSGSGPETFPNVQREGGVDCSGDGWYYDEPTAPTRIILCPGTCSRVNGDTTGRVDVELGCETLLI